MDDTLFPKITKDLEDFFNEEEGNISRAKILMVGSIMVLLGTIMFHDMAYAGHRSHQSHSSHQSHRSGSGGHVSHQSHQSHQSHSSGGGSHSSHGNSTPSHNNASSHNSAPVETVPETMAVSKDLPTPQNPPVMPGVN